MPPHHTDGDIYPFSRPVAPGPRYVKPISAEQIARVMGERPDLYDQLKQPRRGSLDRCADFFGTPFGFGLYIGFIVGSVGTVGAAFVWGLFL